MVELHTNHGVIKLELDAEKAPKSVENFLNYVKKGHYDNTVFHRVIDGFMIQGGGFEPGMKQKPTDAPIENEANNGLKNDKGTLAMARTNDPHSATAQFFINVNDNDFLNHTSPTPQGWGYAVFGKVVDGHGRRREDQEGQDGFEGLPPGRAGRRRRDREGGGRRVIVEATDRRHAPSMRRSQRAAWRHAHAPARFLSADLHLSDAIPNTVAAFEHFIARHGRTRPIRCSSSATCSSSGSATTCSTHRSITNARFARAWRR